MALEREEKKLRPRSYASLVRKPHTNAHLQSLDKIQVGWKRTLGFDFVESSEQLPVVSSLSVFTLNQWR